MPSLKRRESATERHRRAVIEHLRKSELEEQQRREEVIAEFGGGEDPQATLLAMAKEILRYRFAMRQLADAIAWTQEGRPFFTMRGGPYKRDDTPSAA